MHGLSTDTDEILTRIDGGVGFVTLNRPKAINSLTHAMVTAMDATLTGWADDDRVGAVVVA
ncbi:MAG: enoyl-CoA hydratase/isomerase family protein, partial [Mycobacterium sp.]